MSNTELEQTIREGLLLLGYVYNNEALGKYCGYDFINGEEEEEVYISVDFYGNSSGMVFVFNNNIIRSIYNISEYFDELIIKVRVHKLKTLLKY